MLIIQRKKIRFKGYILCFFFAMLSFPINSIGGSGSMYPITPEGVVQKFCELDADGKRISGDTMSDILGLVNWRETGADRIAVIRDFKVGKAIITDSKAEVAVEYDVIGTTDAMEFQVITRKKIVPYKYKLLKNGRWKIDEPISLPHVHWKIAIEHLKGILKSEPDRKEELEAIINKINKAVRN